MATVDPTILALYQTLDLIGVVLNGAIGGSIARQRNFDIIGFAFLALFQYKFRTSALWPKQLH